MFYTYLDKFCLKEITKGGLAGPFGNIPFTQYQLSPMMTAKKKPSARRPVFDASYGSSLNKITPSDHYLEFQAEYDFPKLDSLENLILSTGRGALMWKETYLGISCNFHWIQLITGELVSSGGHISSSLLPTCLVFATQVGLVKPLLLL
jgi:hypothetical protein